MAEIVIMDFSGIYKEEQFFEGEKVSWLDVRELSLIHISEPTRH